MPRGKGNDYRALKHIYEANPQATIESLANDCNVTPMAMLRGLRRANTLIRPVGRPSKNKKDTAPQP